MRTPYDVIESCQTGEQLVVAATWARLYAERMKCTQMEVNLFRQAALSKLRKIPDEFLLISPVSNLPKGSIFEADTQ